MDVLKHSLISILVLATLSACGPSASETSAMDPVFTDGISGGKLAAGNTTDSAYWSVVHLKRKTTWEKVETVPAGIMTSTSVNYIDCTAALIDKDIVITAAHCLDADKTPGPEGFTLKSTGLFAEFTQMPAFEILVTAAVIHPEYKSDSKDLMTYLDNDLAILRLQTPAKEPLKAATLFTTNSTDGSSLMIRRYGYGLTNMVNNKAFGPNEVKPEQSKASDILRTVDGPGTISKTKKRISFDARKLDAGTCPGDSGGPNFTYVNGEAFLVGVNSSYGPDVPDKDLCRGRNTSILVTDYVPWIKSTILKLKSPRP